MGIDELFGGRGKRGLGLGVDALSGLLALLAGKKSGSCGSSEGAEAHNCDECPNQGHCPVESVMRQMKRDRDEAVGADSIMSTEMLMATAKIVGQKAEMKHLGNIVSGLRDMINEMAAAHTAEVKRLNIRHQEELERINDYQNAQLERFREVLDRTREANNVLSEDLQAALGKIGAVLDIVASNGQKRPSRGFLKALQQELGMEEPEQIAAPAAEAGEAETAKG